MSRALVSLISNTPTCSILVTLSSEYHARPTEEELGRHFGLYTKRLFLPSRDDAMFSILFDFSSQEEAICSVDKCRESISVSSVDLIETAFVNMRVIQFLAEGGAELLLKEKVQVPSSWTNVGKSDEFRNPERIEMRCVKFGEQTCESEQTSCYRENSSEQSGQSTNNSPATQSTAEVGCSNSDATNIDAPRFKRPKKLSKHLLLESMPILSLEMRPKTPTVRPIGTGMPYLIVFYVPLKLSLDRLFRFFSLYGDILTIRRVTSPLDLALSAFKGNIGSSRGEVSPVLLKYVTADQACCAANMLRSFPASLSHLGIRSLSCIQAPSRFLDRFRTVAESSRNGLERSASVASEVYSIESDPRDTECLSHDYSVSHIDHRYEMSPLHPRLEAHRCPPTRFLYALNLAPETTASDLKECIELSESMNQALKVHSIRMLEFESQQTLESCSIESERAAELEFEEISSAVDALSTIHDFVLNSQPLKIVFSAPTIQPAWHLR